MVKSNTLYRNNDENETRPKANKSWKWRNILKPIWKQKDLYTVTVYPLSFYPVILPSDPNALLERFDL